RGACGVRRGGRRRGRERRGRGRGARRRGGDQEDRREEREGTPTHGRRILRHIRRTFASSTSSSTSSSYCFFTQPPSSETLSLRRYWPRASTLQPFSERSRSPMARTLGASFFSPWNPTDAVPSSSRATSRVVTLRIESSIRSEKYSPASCLRSWSATTRLPVVVPVAAVD